MTNAESPKWPIVLFIAGVAIAVVALFGEKKIAEKFKGFKNWWVGY